MSNPQQVLPEFVSRQVSEAKRFFLNLAPNSEAELEVVCGGVERMQPDYVVSRIDFPYYAIELVAEGQGTLEVQSRDHALHAGVVFAYGPGIAHRIQNHPANPMRKFYLDFVGRDALQLLQKTGLVAGETWAAIQVGAFHEIIELFEILHRNAQGEGALVSSIASELARLILLKIRQLRVSDGATNSAAYATFEYVRQYVEANFLQLNTVQQIADECHVSAVYLSRLFARYSDCGAYQFLMRHKMNYAAGLLMNEGLLVKEVAARLGFADQFRFSRAFKRTYGVPPKELLRPRQ